MYTIALNTFREILRSRFFSITCFFGVVMLFGIIFFNILSLNQSQFIVPDFGLSFMEVTGLLIILFLGNRLLSREFEEKTIYLTLLRPISRGKIIFGKFFGFAAILLILVLILSTILMGLMIFFEVPVTLIFGLAILGIFLKWLSLLVIILFFSIFLSGGIATFGTLAVYIVAHSGYALLEYATTHEQTVMASVSRGILFFFPNFQALNFKELIHFSFVPSIHTVLVFAFAIGYIVILLGTSYYIFSKKSFDNI